MEIKITKYIEIPVTIWGRYNPEEKPDYSELSPCPGHPENADIERFEIVGLPTPIAQNLIDRYDPGLWENAEEEIIATAKAEIKADGAAKEDTKLGPGLWPWPW